MRRNKWIFLLGVIVVVSGFSYRESLLGRLSKEDAITESEVRMTMQEEQVDSSLKQATFGAGCFWCVEAVFQRLRGVVKVASGYSGGHVKNPTYEQVSNGNTGHAEVCQITYDPSVVTYSELLEVFWKTHDPTTKNRQGNDIGPQYRSAIFYHDQEQKELAEGYRERLESAGIWDRPIVTEISPFEKFWPAEQYHQNYYNNNARSSYCIFVITPKIKKFEEIFKEKLKE